MGYCKEDVSPLLTHWSYVFPWIWMDPAGIYTKFSGRLSEKQVVRKAISLAEIEISLYIDI